MSLKANKQSNLPTHLETISEMKGNVISHFYTQVHILYQEGPFGTDGHCLFGHNSNKRDSVGYKHSKSNKCQCL